MTKILVQCLICFIIIFCINTKANDEGVIRHEIRDDIWPLKNVRKVTNDFESYTYFNSRELEFECNELKQIMGSYFTKKDNESVSLRKICNKLIILVNYKKMEAIPYFKEYTAAHESFHLAVQIFGSPFAYSVQIGAENDYTFINDFVNVVRSSISKNNSCLLITKYLDQISDNKRKYLLFRAMYEWPAEYYAKKAYFDERKDYLTFRNTLTEYSKVPNKWLFNLFYIFSDEFITNLEANKNVNNWKSRVNNGESIIDIYLKDNGCKTYSDSWPKGIVNEYSS